MGKMTNKQASDLFLQQAMANTKRQEQEQAFAQQQAQAVLQSVHMTTAKDLFVGLYLKSAVVPSTEQIDEFAKQARDASDRLLIGLGAQIKRPGE